MAKTTKTISIRIPIELHSQLVRKCKAEGVKQADYGRTALMEKMSSQTSLDFYGEGGGLPTLASQEKVNTKDMQMLVQMGLGGVAGVMGFKLMSMARKHYGYEDDKGVNFLGGIALGILAFWGVGNWMNSTKK